MLSMLNCQYNCITQLFFSYLCMQTLSSERILNTLNYETTEMTTDNITNETGNVTPPRRHHREEPGSKSLLFKVRNVLNIAFILGAAVGMYLYFFQNRTIGTIVILTFAVFKFAECILRFFDK